MAYLERGIPAFRSMQSRHLACLAHLHRHVELVLLEKGHVVAYADAERYELHAGDVFIAFPNQVHFYEKTEGEESSRVLVVEPEMMPELEPILLSSIPKSALLKGCVTEELVSLAEQLRAMKGVSTPLGQIERRGLLLTLFSRVLSLLDLTESREGGSAAFRSVIDYCAHHYTEEISLERLERELHISRYHISHIFSKWLQMGFNDYINSLRVSLACRHLRGDELSVTQVGTLVGFASPRTFNRAFLKHMGTTPSEYRKEKDEL